MKRLLSLLLAAMLVALLPANAWALAHLNGLKTPAPTATLDPQYLEWIAKLEKEKNNTVKYPALEKWAEYYQALIALAIENDDDGVLEYYAVRGESLSPSGSFKSSLGPYDCYEEKRDQGGGFTAELAIDPHTEGTWYLMFNGRGGHSTDGYDRRYAYLRATVQMMTIRAMVYAGMIRVLDVEELTQLVWYLSNASKEGIQIELDGVVFCSVVASGKWQYIVCPADKLKSTLTVFEDHQFLHPRYANAAEYFESSKTTKWSALYP